MSLPSILKWSETSTSKSTLSMANLWARAKFWRTAVKKACGKKRPDTQKEIGWPSVYQRWKKSTRSFRSLYHAVSGFIDRKPTLAHCSGTMFMNSPLPTFSRSSVMTTRPFTARRNRGSCLASRSRSLLYLAASCFTTVLRDSEYIVGNRSSKRSRSNCLGVISMSSAAMSSMTSSGDFPPPPPPPLLLEDPIDMTSSRSAMLSDSAHVISQFS
mmetsp:Transcript_27048/g.70759  ORF Transcript_27048/g.70759 Transcript_27048/m.70759 type:complete len:214 (-) Transcript_27048:1375-2016(-)